MEIYSPQDDIFYRQLTSQVAGQSVHRISHHDPKCRLCRTDGIGLIAQKIPSPYPNPESRQGMGFSTVAEGGPEGNYWYHGTSFNPAESHSPDSLQAPDLYSDRGDKHWNTDLGVHFSSIHDVANNFSKMNDSPYSRIAHTELHMKNPKQFRNEGEFAQDAVNYAGENNYYDPDDPPPHTVRGWDRADYISRRKVNEDWLREHPQRTKVLDKYRKNLISNGHDGVIYGNDYEGPQGHHSAIAFPETPVTIKKWEKT